LDIIAVVGYGVRVTPSSPLILFPQQRPLFETTSRTGAGIAMTVTPPPVVLVVEDDTDTWDLLCVGLKIHGIEGVVATNGQEALEMVRQVVPDAILLDIGLPDMDGTEVCRLLRENPATLLTPIIAFTGHAMPRDVQAALEAGCNAVIVKPTAFPAVMEELRRQLPARFPVQE